MSLKNPMGDFEITDPRAMRALAHPVRLAILSQLQRHGPSTATQLAPHVGATPSVTSWHLRHLAGSAWSPTTTSPDRRQRYWKAVARGLPVRDAGRRRGPGRRPPAARPPCTRQTSDQLQHWIAEQQPRLDHGVGPGRRRGEHPGRRHARRGRGDHGRRSSSCSRRSCTGPTRSSPPDARSVRFLRYSMPQARRRRSPRRARRAADVRARS